ncbi:hypothetical protein OSB04_006933 [Centaurea solstitialis]|uniref:FMR1-interacting protein 1 conserved domain-containing protein n=1 Tax=Centaurea solstitialis TaxID=347529 RepID=A0AA38U3G0_9ASTR|nr:hypothetical protein OSB04_006933 [Centaurea solstitialis]
MHDPRLLHLSALKQFYESAVDRLVAYSDADWAGCPNTRRSTPGFCVYLGDNLVSWSSKRQHVVSRSSAEAKYQGIANVVAEATRLRNLLLELSSPLSRATFVFCDNVSAMYLASNPVQHQRTKHPQFPLITKGLPSSLFLDFRDSLNIRVPPDQTTGGVPAFLNQNVNQQLILHNTIQNICQLLQLQNPPVNFPMFQNQIPNAFNSYLIWASSYKGTHFHPNLLVQFKHSNHLLLFQISRYQFVFMCSFLEFFGGGIFWCMDSLRKKKGRRDKGCLGSYRVKRRDGGWWMMFLDGDFKDSKPQNLIATHKLSAVSVLMLSLLVYNSRVEEFLHNCPQRYKFHFIECNFGVHMRAICRRQIVQEHQISQGMVPQNHSYPQNQLFGMANSNGPGQAVHQGQQRVVAPMMDVNSSRQMANTVQQGNLLSPHASASVQNQNPHPTLPNFEDNHGNMPAKGNARWTESQCKNFTGHKKNDVSHKGFKSQFQHAKHTKEKFGTYNGIMNKEGNNNAAVNSGPLNSTNQIHSEKKFCVKYTEQEVKQWREARKKHYPSSANVEKIRFQPLTSRSWVVKLLMFRRIIYLAPRNNESQEEKKQEREEYKKGKKKFHDKKRGRGAAIEGDDERMTKKRRDQDSPNNNKPSFL